MREIAVTNKHPKDFSDAFNGVKYVFPAGKTVNISVAAAVHIFGYNQKDKTLAHRRQGHDAMKAAAFLGGFDLKMIELVPSATAEEVEDLRVELELAQDRIKDLEGDLAAATTTIEQLKADLAQAGKTSD